MGIPEHIIDEIRQQTDIVEVIGETVRLQKRGRNYLGLCPFHNEKTPSFNVLPDRGIFKCFGCGKGGNVLTFMMEYHKLTFPDALKILAQKAGIELPNSQDSDDEKEKGNRYNAVYDALRTAANHYFKKLYEPEGKIALDYLYKRGFKDDIIKQFGLGFSQDAWAGAKEVLEKQGFTPETLSDAGLMIIRDDGRSYDRFRGRLMFPIQNPMGKVIGFGARRLKEEEAAKYINSPQSLVYDKSQVLYGIFQAKDEIRKLEFAILVEGYADLLSVYQAGFHNVVASSGTALTKEQLKLLHRYCKQLFIVYDADIAGTSASLRGMEIALEEGFDVHLVRLPKGDDPDSFIQAKGAKAFEAELKKSLSFVDFKGEVLKEQGLLATPTGQAEAVRSLVETISKVPDRIKRDFMVRAVALRFALNEQSLYDELNLLQRKSRLKTGISSDSGLVSDGIVVSTEKSPEHISEDILSERIPTESVQKGKDHHEWKNLLADLIPEEIEILRIALMVPGAISYLEEKIGIKADDLFSSTGKMMFAMVMKEGKDSRDPFNTIMNSRIDDTMKIVVSDIALKRETPSERWKEYDVDIIQNVVRVIMESLCRLQLRELKAQYQNLQAELKSVTEERQIEILRKMDEVDRKSRSVKERFFV